MWGSRFVGNRLPILVYHSISKGWNDELSLSPAIFDEQMAWLCESGFQVVALETALQKLKQRADLRRCLVLTFDDGYADFLEHAAPVLGKYGLPATVFVVTGKLGRKSDWHRFSPSRWLLSLEDLRGLRQAGYSIGSHTHSHSELPRLPAPDLEAELRASRDFLETQLGVSPIFFSYPYRTFGERERQAVIQAGYDCACTAGGWWDNGYETDLFRLNRFEIHRSHSPGQFRTLVASPFKWPLVRQEAERVLYELRARLRAV